MKRSLGERRKLQQERFLLKSHLSHVLEYLLLVVQAAVICVPILYIALSAFKYRFEVFSTYIVFSPTIQNFHKILFDTSYSSVFTHSAAISILAVLLTLCLAIPAAYGFSRFRFRGKNSLLFFVITTRMAPPTAFLVIYFVLFARIGAIDKLPTMVVLYTMMNLGFSIWLLKSFFDDVPRELDEAAVVDGCSWLRTLWTIIVPLSRTGIIVTGIFVFIYSWNEYLYALVFTRTATKTLPVFVPQFMGVTYLEYEVMCAAATLALLPVIVAGVLMRKYLTRGLTMGALKG